MGIVAGNTPEMSFDYNTFSTVVDKLSGAFGNIFSTIKGKKSETVNPTTGTTTTAAGVNYTPMLLIAGGLVAGAIVLKAVLK